MSDKQITDFENKIKNIDILADGEMDEKNDKNIKDTGLNYLNELKNRGASDEVMKNATEEFIDIMTGKIENHILLANKLQAKYAELKKDVVTKTATESNDSFVVGGLKKLLYTMLSATNNLKYPSEKLDENTDICNFLMGVIDELLSLPELIEQIITNGEVRSQLCKGIGDMIKNPKILLDGIVDQLAGLGGNSYDKGRAGTFIVLSLLGLGGAIKGVASGAAKTVGKLVGKESAKGVIKSMIKAGAISSIDDIVKAGIKSVDDLIKSGFKSIDDIVELGVIKNIDDLAKIGIKDIKDLAKFNIKNTDDLVKIGVKSFDDLVKLRISNADDLVKIGIKTPEDLIKFGKITKTTDLSKIGLNSTDDLVKIGINSADDLSKIGLKIDKLDDLFKKDLSKVVDENGIIKNSSSFNASNNAASEIYKAGVKSVDDLVKIGITDIKTLSKYIKGANNLEKFGIKHIDDLAKFGKITPDDLIALGLNNVDDMANFGIKSAETFKKIGIKNSKILLEKFPNIVGKDMTETLINLEKIGLDSVDNLTALKINLKTLKESFKLDFEVTNNARNLFEKLGVKSPELLDKLTDGVFGKSINLVSKGSSSLKKFLWDDLFFNGKATEIYKSNLNKLISNKEVIENLGKEALKSKKLLSKDRILGVVNKNIGLTEAQLLELKLIKKQIGLYKNEITLLKTIKNPVTTFCLGTGVAMGTKELIDQQWIKEISELDGIIDSYEETNLASNGYEIDEDGSVFFDNGNILLPYTDENGNVIKPTQDIAGNWIDPYTGEKYDNTGNIVATLDISTAANVSTTNSDLTTTQSESIDSTNINTDSTIDSGSNTSQTNISSGNIPSSLLQDNEATKTDSTLENLSSEQKKIYEIIKQYLGDFIAKIYLGLIGGNLFNALGLDFNNSEKGETKQETLNILLNENNSIFTNDLFSKNTKDIFESLTNSDFLKQNTSIALYVSKVQIILGIEGESNYGEKTKNKTMELQRAIGFEDKDITGLFDKNTAQLYQKFLNTPEEERVTLNKKYIKSVQDLLIKKGKLASYEKDASGSLVYGPKTRQAVKSIIQKEVVQEADLEKLK